MKKDKQISMKINSDLLQKVQDYAVRHKWSVSQAICVILEEYFKEPGSTE